MLAVSWTSCERVSPDRLDLFILENAPFRFFGMRCHSLPGNRTEGGVEVEGEDLTGAGVVILTLVEPTGGALPEEVDLDKCPAED